SGDEHRRSRDLPREPRHRHRHRARRRPRRSARHVLRRRLRGTVVACGRARDRASVPDSAGDPAHLRPRGRPRHRRRRPHPAPPVRPGALSRTSPGPREPRVPGAPSPGSSPGATAARSRHCRSHATTRTRKEPDMKTYEQNTGVAHLRAAPWNADQALAARMATAPGLVRAGAASWDGSRTPIHPLSLESAYADPTLLRDLGARGARFARELGADVVVGAETAGVPLAAAVSLAGGLPFAFVRKPGYRGHELDEPPVRGA